MDDTKVIPPDAEANVFMESGGLGSVPTALELLPLVSTTTLNLELETLN